MYESPTKNQVKNVYDYTQDIISHLSPKALEQLLGGYDNDITQLVGSIMKETNEIINFDKSVISSNDVLNLEKVEKCMHERLKVLSYNYFKATCLPEFT